MAGSTMPNRLALDYVLLRCEEETDEVCLGKDVIGGG